MPELWAGTDAGKAEHHCTVIDANGTALLSRRVPDSEAELLELLGDVWGIADGGPVTWAVDLNAGGASLWIALLVSHGQKLLNIPGRTVHHASAACRGSGKTDAKDAFIIAGTARMRRDLQPLQERGEIAVDLRILTVRRIASQPAAAARSIASARSCWSTLPARMRRDLQPLQERGEIAVDLRILTVRRIASQPAAAARSIASARSCWSTLPALERAFGLSTSQSELILLVGYQTPQPCEGGRSRLRTWLKNHGVRTSTAAKSTAEAAVTAGEAQFTVVPGEGTCARMVHTLAATVIALDEEVSETEAQIDARCREHPDAEVITSVPGIG
ncbi:transposase [Streptomyces sp. NPDC008121]|uniref:IS110 family transposase n=1 Tax=Streptomyces sp. NPDC008121 TaxID=3364809 RepID=UPI0036F13177